MGWGDDMMWLGEAQKARLENTDKVITPDTEQFSALWKHIDWIVPKGTSTAKEQVVVSTKPNGNRWYIDGWASDRILFKDYEPKPAYNYTITQSELKQAEELLANAGVKKPFVLVNPDSKNTTFSDNKDWSFKRWRECSRMISDYFTVVRLQPPKSVTDVSGVVNYDNPPLRPATNIETDDIRVALAIASLSKAIVTTEGLMHHFAAAINKQCFVIFGGHSSINSTGYKNRNQTVYTYKHEMTPCGKTSSCNHCKDAMRSIKPDVVAQDVLNYMIYNKVSNYE